MVSPFSAPVLPGADVGPRHRPEGWDVAAAAALSFGSAAAGGPPEQLLAKRNVQWCFLS